MMMNQITLRVQVLNLKKWRNDCEKPTKKKKTVMA